MSRSNYWGNSKLAKKLREWLNLPVPPVAATAEEWRDFNKSIKGNKLYWLTDDFLDKAQDVFMWPIDTLDSFSYWIYNRFIQPTHICKTDLEPGQWHESDEKIMHAMFTELVDFVECQKAWMNWDDESCRPWWWKRYPYFIRKLIPYRSQHHGVRHLLWEISLKQDDEWFGIYDDMPEDKKNELRKSDNYGTLTPQAITALKILTLYVWWKFIRPMRSDPMDGSGYSEYFERRRSELKDDGVWGLLADDDKEWKQYSDAMHKIEEAYDREDTECMIELIKVRRNLWT